MKKALCILAALLFMLPLLPLPTLGETLAEGPFTFTMEGGEAMITGYTGTETNIMIPDNLGCCPVTAIGERAFAGKKHLNSVTLPEGIRTIGDNAFDTCSGLESVILPKSLTIIGKSAFSGCSALDSITLPEGLASIGGYAFTNCMSLASIMIPDGVTEIGDSVFSNCASLESITLPPNLHLIGNWAFEDCASLESVAIPDGVTSIGTGAFKDCKSLRSITIPEGVTVLKESAFYGCAGLLSVRFPESLTRIGVHAFYGCASLQEADIPTGTAIIVTGAFTECASLASVQLSELTRVNGSAFKDCPRARFTYYGTTESMEKLPPYKLLTLEALRARMGGELSDFVPAHPQSGACLLVVGGVSMDGSLTSQADAFRYIVIEDSGGKLRFTQVPDLASVLLKMYVSYSSAGQYYGGGTWVTGYNCEVNLSAVDMRTHSTIATVTAGEYLGDTIFFSRGQTTYYADFPGLDTADVQAFVDKIVAYESAP